MSIEAIGVEPFAIPLRERFTISRASVDSTRAVLVRAQVAGHTGYGEAALPLGSRETVDDLRHAIERAGASLLGQAVASPQALSNAVEACFEGLAAARSGLHCALLDALARSQSVPLYRLLGAGEPIAMTTDITLPIAAPARQAELASEYRARGFRLLKLKVGADLDSDKATLDALAGAVPEAVLRFDANEGFDVAAALSLLDHARSLGLTVDCFEQPCPRADHASLREVRRGGVPVVADESLAGMDDLQRLVDAGAVDGVNLKLVKLGGIDRAVAIGRAAKQAGLDIMVGAMIESRLGLTAMAHVVAAIGGAQWVDLDTAFLLAADPVRGGMIAEGAELTLPDAPGLGIELTATSAR